MSQFSKQQYDAVINNVRDIIPNIAREITVERRDEPMLFTEMWGMVDHPYQSGVSGSKLNYYGIQSPNPFTHTYKKKVGRSLAGSDHNDPHNACSQETQRIQGDGMDMTRYDLEDIALEDHPFCVDEYIYANFADSYLKARFNSLYNYGKQVLENKSFEEIFRMSKKAFVDATGKLITTRYAEDFQTIPAGTPISRLSGGILEDIYDGFISEGAEPVTSLGGNKAFLLIGDPSDIRNWQREEFLSNVTANNISDVQGFLNRYSINDTFDNMFVISSSEKMPRANVDANGEVELVFREANNIKAEIGYRKGANQAFLDAKYTISLAMSKGIGDQVVPNGNEISIDAFKSRNLGFSWSLWRDPNCIKGNVVQLWTEDTRGFMKNPRASVYAILTLRKPAQNNAVGWTETPCLEEPVVCPPVAYTEECPCPQLSEPCEGLTENSLFFNLEPAQVGLAGAISIRTSADTVVNATASAINTTGTRVNIDFGVGVTPSTIPGFYKELLCDPFGECCSEVVYTKDCTAGDDILVASVYDKLVELADGDALIATHCNGETTEVVYALAESDLALNKYAIGAAGLEAAVCENGDISFLCVVPTAANGCPDCDPSYVEACVPTP